MSARIKQRSKPSGWGMYSKETGNLLAYHGSEVVVQRWAEKKERDGVQVEVENIAEREVRLKEGDHGRG